MKPVETAAVLIVVVAATLAGDYFIKLASQRQGGLASRDFLIGAALYAAPAVGWFFLMRAHSLAAIGVFYSASMLVLLAVLGTVVFREAFGLREAIGVGLAVASVLVMSH
jgi:undecaprenyl phosphate-alpha-L-ara4N flippase subunit ArnF